MNVGLKNLLLYGGATKAEYRRVYPDIIETNRANLFAFSLFAAVLMAFLSVICCFDTYVHSRFFAYATCLVVSVVIAGLSSRKNLMNHIAVFSAVYLFMGTLFFFTIMCGTIVAPDEMTVDFLMMLFVLPLLFVDSPARMGSISAVAVVCYLVAAFLTQPTEVFYMNVCNVLLYGSISGVVGTYLMCVKVKRLLLEQQNKKLIETDQLTGMLNRRSFEGRLQELRQDGCPEGLMVCMFDVNGLKAINDSIGHHAGDELICAAGNIVSGVFGRYGKCYRTGGDEFAAVLEPGAPSPEELKSDLNARCSGFRGTHVSSMAVSMGCVVAEGGEEVSSLLKRADGLMYEDKREYYSRAGIDRRRR